SAVAELPVGIDEAGLTATVAAVWDRHDVLRSRLMGDGMTVAAPGSVDVAELIHRVECDGVWDEAWLELAGAELDAATGLLDPVAGVMGRLVWFDAGPYVPG